MRGKPRNACMIEITKLHERLVKLLRQDARLTDGKLSTMLGISEDEVAKERKILEDGGVICGYTAIVNEALLNPQSITAIIEIKTSPNKKYGYAGIASTISRFPNVESVRLMSGNYDLAITVKCDDIRQVGKFVDEQLSVLDGVLGTATHFIIGRYKEMGMELSPDEDERGMVSP